MATVTGGAGAARGSRRLAVGVSVVVVLAIASMLARGRSAEVVYARWMLHNGPLAVAEVWLGWAILRRRHAHGLGRVFLVCGTLFALHVAVMAYVDARLVGSGVGDSADVAFVPGAVPTDLAVAHWLTSWVWLVAVAGSLVLFLLLFPDGRLPSRRWWPVAALAGLATVLVVAGYMRWSWPGATHRIRITDQPSDLPGTFPLLTTGWVLLLAALTAAIASLGVRWQVAPPAQRTQLRPVVWSGSLLAIVGVPLFPWQAVWVPGVLVASVLFLGAYVFAVLRLQLHDVDVVVNRAVVASLLAALATGVYLAVVVGAGSLVERRAAHPLLPLVAAGLIAVLFEPARRRVRRVVDRLLYRRDADAYELLSELAHQLEHAGPLDHVAGRVVDLLTRGTGAAGARIVLREPSGPDGPEIAGAGDRELVEVLRTPVLHDGEELAAVCLHARGGGELAPDAQALVHSVAGMLGPVLRNARLTTELQAQVAELRRSRQRLVDAQDTARRQLERDLHDGAQAALVALRLRVGIASADAEALPDAAAAATVREDLRRLADEVDDTIRSLRELSRGLHPPVLASDGIAVALRGAVRALPLDVEVHAPVAARFPVAVETAVYFSCLEAVKNAATHGRARCVRVRLSAEDGWLTFTVSDDGIGFDPGTAPGGTGLANLSDRVGALDGELTVTSAPGRGTRVEGRVPAPSLTPDPPRVPGQPLVSER